MSEDETNHCEISNVITPVSGGFRDHKKTFCQSKSATGGDISACLPSVSEAQDEYCSRVASVGGKNDSSMFQKSSEMESLTRYSHQVDGELRGDVGNFVLSRQLSSVCTKKLSILGFATPKTKGKMVEPTPNPLTITDGRSPLARFPIAIQPTHRLTPGTLTKRVVGDSGGQFVSEDTRQVQLISSPCDKPHQGLKADLWDIDAESMISELQPEPLQINRQRPRANTGDDRRWSGMCDELNADVSSTVGRIGINTSCDHSKAMDYEFATVDNVDDDHDNHTVTEGDRTPRALDNMIPNLANTTPTPRGLQRSASTIITPTQSTRRLQHQASYNLENDERSGFTPEHLQENVIHGTFPRSGVILNLQDTQARLRYPLQDPEEVRLSRNLDETTPKTRRFHDAHDTDRCKQYSVKEWVKSIATTPRRHRITSHIRVEDDADPSVLADQTCSHGTLNHQDARPFAPPSTRYFSQRTGLKHIPSNAHQSLEQQFDTQSEARSPPPPSEEQKFAHRRTPSPAEQHGTAVPRTPSSGIGSILRRMRSDHGAPATPRTLASPQLAWRPFEDDQPEPPCSSPWLSGHREDKQEIEKRRAFFREKVERELEGRQSPKRPSRKSSFGSVTTRDHGVQKSLALDNRTSNESLVAWRSFIQDAPEPLFSSPPPPVPPLPTGSQLDLALNRLQQAQTPSRVVTGDETSPITSYRARKPYGLRVDTDWARKAIRDGTRTPSRNTGATPASGNSLRTAFRLNGRRMSHGRTTAEEECQVLGRDDEVISRRN